MKVQWYGTNESKTKNAVVVVVIVDVAVVTVAEITETSLRI